MHGIRYGIKNPEILKAELKAMKRVAASGKKVGVMMPQIIGVEEVKKVKEFLKEINFHDVNLGVMIETPAAVQIIKELCEEGIKFISFGTNDLTQYILAVDRGNEQVQSLYNEMHPAVLYQLAFVIRICRRYGVETSICGQAASKKEMVKYLVENNIDSISVNADVAKDISDYVEELEKKLVEGTDKEPRKYQPQKEKHEAHNPEYKDKEINPPMKFDPGFKKYEVDTEKIEEDIEAIEEEKKEYLKGSKDNEEVLDIF
jgi:pyruvate,water dikinase